MTLIAFTVEPDHVEIITDTLSYDRRAVRLGTTSKVTLLSHLDAAVMNQGTGELGTTWRSVVGALPI